MLTHSIALESALGPVCGGLHLRKPQFFFCFFPITWLFVREVFGAGGKGGFTHVCFGS
jgi:hypothetical protein